MRSLDKFIILRHDVDLSLNYAFQLAKLEADRGLHAIYFVLLHTGMYNVMSESGARILRQMSKMGHEIGLHIDTRFFQHNRSIISQIEEECRILENIIEEKIASISQHTPIITPDLPGELGHHYTDARDPKVLERLKYISDSGRNWRQGCMCNHVGKVDRLQILTHPVWWVASAESRDATLNKLRVDAMNEAAANVESFRQTVHKYVKDQLHQQ